MGKTWRLIFDNPIMKLLPKPFYKILDRNNLVLKNPIVVITFINFLKPK